jgi:dienelactone hydrolase
MVPTARIEIHCFKSTTPSNKEFLTGAKSGTTAIIGGSLCLPKGTEPLPAVILVHGSGGVGANVDRWARELNQIGFAAFVLDCFTGRGIVETITDQSRLGHLAMIGDAYRALELLVKHQRIDASRIAVMGFSKGGFAALYASLRRFQLMHGSRESEFAAYISFYAPCNTAFLRDLEVADRPIRLFHGTADNYVSVEPARKYVERLRGAGKDVHLTEYEGAHHVFDNPLYTPPLVLADALTMNHCSLEERTGGQIVNSATGRPFTMNDDCVSLGATLSYDSVSTAKAITAVTNFLQETLQPRN